MLGQQGRLLGKGQRAGRSRGAVGVIGSGTILEHKNSISEIDIWSCSTLDSVTSMRGKRVTWVLIQQLVD